MNLTWAEFICKNVWMSETKYLIHRLEEGIHPIAEGMND
jgi:hypothetical protein